MMSPSAPVQHSHKPATPMGLPSTRVMRVGTALPVRQSSSKNAIIGTMQRCPASQASRVLLDVVTVSERVLTILVERSLASDADLTQRGTKPNCPCTNSRAEGAISVASGASAPSGMTVPSSALAAT